MNEVQLKNIIDAELKNGQFDNWHGVSFDNVNDYLVEPRYVSFKDVMGSGVRRYWLVFDEDSCDAVEGYQIVYDEINGQFALAIKTSMPEKEIGSVLSFYETFREALSAM